MKGIMIQGTASHVGKSIITTAICRLLVQRGHRVSPFKAQTMTSHTATIGAEYEIGISQWEQAEASRLSPAPWMNPVLLKPTSKGRTEVFLLGVSQGVISGADFKNLYYDKVLAVIKKSLHKTSRNSDYVVIEGAGSPVEMNLKERDLSNMAIAELADVPALLVADIERGGAFASIVGTLALLKEHERERVKGIIINKFYGDASLFDSGREWLQNKTGIPVLGVIPFIEHQLEEEDNIQSTGEKLEKRSKEAEYDKLANHLESYLDVARLLDIMEGDG